MMCVLLCSAQDLQVVTTRTPPTTPPTLARASPPAMPPKFRFATRHVRSSRVLGCRHQRHAGDAVVLDLRMFSCVGALEGAVGVHADVLHRLQKMARLLIGIDVVHGWAPVAGGARCEQNVHTS